MKAFFSVSSRTNIDSDYLVDARYISNSLAEYGYDIVIGVAMNEGMPGEVLKNFNENGRKIYLKTLKIYEEDPKVFNYVDFDYANDTFERTKKIYDEGDILIMMPGGTGTTAEIMAFLEQARTDILDGKDPKTIVIYNKDAHYDQLISLIKKYIDLRFNSDDIFAYLNVIDDKGKLVDFVSRQFDIFTAKQKKNEK